MVESDYFVPGMEADSERGERRDVALVSYNNLCGLVPGGHRISSPYGCVGAVDCFCGSGIEVFEASASLGGTIHRLLGRSFRFLLLWRDEHVFQCRRHAQLRGVRC